jgi:hypothetical protein
VKGYLPKTFRIYRVSRLKLVLFRVVEAAQLLGLVVSSLRDARYVPEGCPLKYDIILIEAIAE